MGILKNLLSGITKKEETAGKSLTQKFQKALITQAPSASSELVFEIMKLRLSEYISDGRVDWTRANMAPLWEAEPASRSEHVSNLVKVISAIIPPNRGKLQSYVYSFQTIEGLRTHLEIDIWFALKRILKRKTKLDDETASQLISRLLWHYESKNLIVLNAVLDSVSTSSYPKTLSALRNLQFDLHTEKYPVSFVKNARAKISKLLPEDAEAAPAQADLPDVKWVTWNSVERIKQYFDDVGGEEITDRHMKTLEGWRNSLDLDQHSIQIERLKLLKSEMQALKRQNLLPPAKFMTEYDDLSGYGGVFHNDAMKHYAREQLNGVIALARCLSTLSVDQREIWLKWKALSKALIGKTSPTKMWLEEASLAFAGISKANQLRFLQYVTTSINWPSRISGSNAETLRAAIYGSIRLPEDKTCGLLAEFAAKYCFVTVPQVGICSEKLGNACLWALINRSKGEGIPHLSRLHLKIKYPKVKTKIGVALDEAAKSAGISRGALEEQSFRDLGIGKDGKKLFPIGTGDALVSITEMGKVRVGWRVGEGEYLDTPPSKLKSEKKTIKTVRDFIKEVEVELSAHHQRLQKIWLEDRTWESVSWIATYANHPVVRALSRRLIWIAQENSKETPFVFRDGTAQDIAGETVSLQDATISLWHPVLRPVKEVLAWRRRIVELGIAQPFKQAHREIYVVTPAEQTTGTYSNRFAGHILKQHQLVSLARLNGWSITHRISADTPNDAPTHFVVSAHGLVAEYWTEAAGGEDAEFNDAGAYLYLSTDQLRFYKIANPEAPIKRVAFGPERGDLVPIKDVPKIVLSEIMRHCDLFVGVASVANDPNWRDSGANAEHPDQWRMTTGANYWTRQSFGDLDQSSETRKELLNELLPALAIGSVSQIEGRFLKVKGKLRTYKIHLGSGNVLMEPNDTYLCIVPSRARSKDNDVRLPFEGDQKLSIILSKALLLADDNKIQDQSITAQIRSK